MLEGLQLVGNWQVMDSGLPEMGWKVVAPDAVLHKATHEVN